MFVFAYEARHADAPVIDPSTGARFLTTSYSRAEAFARTHGAVVAQAGSGSAPYDGAVADAVAQDRVRETVPNGTENAPPAPCPAPSTPKKARKRAPAAAKEASHA